MDGSIEAEKDKTGKNLYATKLTKIILENPYEDPEVKDIMYHLENAGRDFFRLDRNTGLVGVDISVREWIQESDPTTNSTSQETRGFNKYRDPKGNTVFKFTLTPSFVRYGDSLSELFKKKDAHMSIAINIRKVPFEIRALNNASFQKRHMPWLPDWYISNNESHSSESRELFDHEKACKALGYEPADMPVCDVKPRANRRPRYEVLHWHDHVRILQNWWTDESRNDTWWTELLTQLSIFIRPENWYRWNIQRPYSDRNYDPKDIMTAEYFNIEPNDVLTARFLEQPIHLAAELGLHLLVDLLVQQPSGPVEQSLQSYPHREFDIREFKVSRVKSSLRSLEDGYRRKTYMNTQNFDGPYIYTGIFTFSFPFDIITLEEAIAILNATVRNISGGMDGMKLVMPLIEAMGTPLRVVWLASQVLECPDLLSNNKPGAASELSETPLKNQDDDLTPIEEHFDYDSFEIAERIKTVYEIFAEKDDVDLQEDVTNLLQHHNYDKTRIAEKLQDIIPSSPNSSLKPWKGSICDIPSPFGSLPLYTAARNPATVDVLIKHKANVNAPQNKLEDYERAVSDSMLLSILLDITFLKEPSEDFVQLLLTSAKALIATGARLDVKTSEETSILHMAAQIRDLKFFKLLVVSWEWDDPPAKNIAKIQETLDLCQVIMKMRRVDGGEFINAEDCNSEMPLSGAVRGGFKQAVELLISLGADVHDENDFDQNYFHVLAGGTGTEDDTDAAIAKIFFDAGLDCTKPDHNGITPISLALQTSKWNIINLFLQKYEAVAKEPTDGEKSLILHKDKHGCSLLHLFSRGSGVYGDDIKWTELFSRVLSLFSTHGGPDKFISQVDLLGETPLHLAIRYRRQGVLNQILDLDPSNGTRSLDGYTPLDALCEQVGHEFFAVANGNNFYETRLATSKAMLAKVFEKAPTLSLSHFETRLFDPEIGETANLLKKLNLFEVMKIYDTFVDEHGWTLFDLLSVYGRSDLASSCMQKCFSSSNMFKKPFNTSRINTGQKQVIGHDGEDDDQEAREDKIIWGYCTPSYAPSTIIADHPIPPVNMTFYFEVAMLELSGSSAEEDPYTFWIGLEPTHRRSNTFGGGVRNILYGSLGWLNIDGAAQYFDISSDTPGIGSYTPTSTPAAYGCGFNPLEGKCFFTVDGKILPWVWNVPLRRYFPIFETNTRPDDHKFNFGDEPFMFKQANDSNWRWHGSFNDTDILDENTYWKPQADKEIERELGWLIPQNQGGQIDRLDTEL
ncbi:hypothetical protein ABW20_dc0100615 [Dactylellina cionopaga]|nr:hypothetical protein ABW20_dc0100615 [Dactylellina cionopaga]